MKTIFIAINRGMVARNILRSGVLKRLLENENINVVIIVNTKILDYFRREFSQPRVTLEQVKNKNYSKFRKFFIILFNGLVYTETERRKIKFGGGKKGPNEPIIFWIKHLSFLFFSRIKFLKYCARWIEMNLFSDNDYDYLFEKYKPDLVFCASLYSRGMDTVLIKAAKRFGVLSVSMPKSWDTVGRLFFSAPSDKIILQNDFMKKRVVKEQLIKPENLFVSGFPQFDIYHNKKTYLQRSEFCKKCGLDPQKPVILYASEGIWTHWDDAYLEDFIINFKILDKYNLIIRPHWSNLHENLYDRFRKYDCVYIDDQHTRITDMFGDHWDPSESEMDWLCEVIKNSDVVITSVSTFVLDVLAFDRPVINIFYDLKPDRALAVPVIPMRELYNCVHYNAVMDEGPTILAKSSQEVLESIQYYLQHPEHLSKERKKTVDKLCYKIDGLSSERIATIIKSLLANK